MAYDWHNKPVQIDFNSVINNKQPQKTIQSERKSRIVLLKFVCIVWVIVLLARLFSLQVSNFDTWRVWAKKQHHGEVRIATERGPVYDRNHNVLTISVPAGSIFARPKLIKDKVSTAKQLAQITGEKPELMLAKLESKKPFVWIKRQVPRVDAKQIENLKNPGLGYMLEARRYYPHNYAAAVLLGKVGVDGNGLSGLEAAYDKQLNIQNVRASIRRDALGKYFKPEDSKNSFSLPKGSSLNLTLDSNIQVLMDEELEAGRKKANAISAMAVMIDADNGEVLGLSQAPLINLNLSKYSINEFRNKIVETVFEPGSIMKPLVAAVAIDQGIVMPNSQFDCENGRYYYGKRLIKDVHGSGVLTVRDIVVRSSNIGMTKIGHLMGKEKLYQSLRDFGFGEVVDLKLAGQTKGILRNVDNWAEVDVATHSFGQGVAVTPLQVVRAMASLVNGGLVPDVHLVKSIGTKKPKRVLTETTAAIVKEMMYAVVEDEHGTGSNAKMPGVRVGGKTGTAQKARKDGRGYEAGKYIASFVGFVDGFELGLNNRLVLAVMVDEPNTTSIYGGTLAAPVFKRIMQRTLHYLSTRESLKDPNLFVEKSALPAVNNKINSLG
jgi:cell division protein FtsI (penicillin-binding protein 3)